jgi:hypothetical protein
MKIVAIAVTVAALALSGIAPALADDTKAPDGKQLTLVDGTVHQNPGEMFQHLRDRDNGYAAGNPKDIVNAYPNEFDNVGDLIQQKRAATQ